MKKRIKVNIIGSEIIPKIRISEIIGSLTKEIVISEHLNGDFFEFSLLLTGKKEIKKLNKEWRNNLKVTDVLSFPFNENEKENYLGDVAICVPVMKKQAKTYGHSETREFAFLLAHAIFHLLGYDHINEDDENIMREKQTSALNRINISRLYK